MLVKKGGLLKYKMIDFTKFPELVDRLANLLDSDKLDREAIRDAFDKAMIIYSEIERRVKAGDADTFEPLAQHIEKYTTIIKQIEKIGLSVSLDNAPLHIISTSEIPYIQ